MNWKKLLQPRRIARAVGEVVLLVALFFAISAFQTRSMASGPAPALAGELLDGGHFDLNQLQGRPAVIHFWATWCGICRREAGTIRDLAVDHSVITVAMQSERAEVEQFLHLGGGRYPVLLDESGELSRRFGVQAVPATFILDSNGTIRYATVGYTTELGLRTRLWLAGG